MMEKIPFELRMTGKNMIMGLLGGPVIFVVTLSVILWFIQPVLINPDSKSLFFLSALLLIAFLTGALRIVYFALHLSYLLVVSSIMDSHLLLKYKGILYRMDKTGFTYHENKKIYTKAWSEIEDVGCFKQQDEKKLLYKYQIKFTDGSTHTFDLRGTYATEDFKKKVEEFWFYYN